MTTGVLSAAGANGRARRRCRPRIGRLPGPRAGRAAAWTLLLLSAGLVGGAPRGEAAPKVAPRPGWVYDRLVLAPGGDSLSVLAWLETPGVPFDPGGAAAAPRRLLFDLANRRVSVDPEVVAFQLSPDRRTLLLLGERGLWWHDREAGHTTQLYFQSPDGGARVYDYAFRAGGPGAVFLTGAPGDRQGALYRFTPPVSIERVSDHRPGTPPPPAWHTEARPAERPPVTTTRGARRFTVGGASPLRLDYDGATLLVESGSAVQRVPVDGVSIEWASWPGEGGAALVALRENSGRPRLLAAAPDRPPRFFLDGEETPSVAWLDPTMALVSTAGGALYRYDAAADTMGRFSTGRPPEWALVDVPASDVVTLRIQRWPRSARRFEEQQVLLGKGARELPASLRTAALAYGRRLGGAGVQLVGVYPTLESAAAAAPAFRRLGIELEPSTCPALDMTGGFDYAERVTVRGDRVWIRRLPGAGGSEIWWHPSGGEPERLLSREMTP